ncbi:MAG: hypothetical protein WBO24_19455, partial [Nitrospirales bacterium]
VTAKGPKTTGPRRDPEDALHARRIQRRANSPGSNSARLVSEFVSASRPRRMGRPHHFSSNAIPKPPS